MWLPEAVGKGKRDWLKMCQKAQTSDYKINKY